jgi:hypothetical protein
MFDNRIRPHTAVRDRDSIETLPKKVHLHVISEAAAPWGDLERIYASVNKVTL